MFAAAVFCCVCSRQYIWSAPRLLWVISYVGCVRVPGYSRFVCVCVPSFVRTCALHGRGTFGCALLIFAAMSLCDSLVCLVPLLVTRDFSGPFSISYPATGVSQVGMVLWVDGFHLVSYFSTLCVTVVLVGEGNSRHQCY